MIGKKIFEYELDVVRVTDSGVSLEEVLSGNTKIPLSGVRVDVAFEGQAKGDIAGRVYGVDYIQIRPDGSILLDIRAMIETTDGHRIAISADGRATASPTTPVAQLRENISLSTASEKYQWLNAHQIWGVGQVDFSTQKILIEAYMQ